MEKCFALTLGKDDSEVKLTELMLIHPSVKEFLVLY